MDYGLLAASEMEAFIRVLAGAGPGRMPDAAERKLHAELHEYLKPALDRFAALDTDDERDGFRGALQDFVRAYSLIAQIVDWGDPDLERLYQLRPGPADPAARPAVGVGRHRRCRPEPLRAGVHRAPQRVALGRR